MSTKNSDKVVVRSGGIGFGGLLAVLFIGLKLCGVIGWSWWWILSPLWIPVAIVLTISLGLLIFAGLVLLLAKIFNVKL